MLSKLVIIDAYLRVRNFTIFFKPVEDEYHKKAILGASKGVEFQNPFLRHTQEKRNGKYQKETYKRKV